MQASRCTAAAVPAAPATNLQRWRRRVVRAAAARRPAASQQQRDADRQQEAQQPQQLGLSPLQKVATGAAGLLASAVLLTAPGSALAADTAAVGTCLLQNCQAALAQCLTDVTCAENLVCLQLCNGRPDETECQIKCGDKYSDKAVETFTACAVSEKKCVPQRIDEDAYPVPPDSALDNSFDLSNFQGRWYITAGLNPLFDTFDCQEHFFASPEPNKVFAKINWRIPMSDALTGDQDFIERSVMQKFVQEDPAKQPSVLVNKDNEFLNYQDTWYVLAFKPDNYVFIYYRGQNDAWLGYGGATVYTRASTLPREDIPELKAAAERAGLDWSKFTITNNSCPPHPPKAALPEKLRVAAVRRTAQAEYELENDLRSFGRGFTVLEQDLSNKLRRTENTIVEDIKAVGQVEKKLEQTAGKAEKLIEKEVEEVEAAAARMIRRFEAEAKMGPWINWIPKSWRPVIMPMD